MLSDWEGRLKIAMSVRVVVSVKVNSGLLVHHLDLGRRVELASVPDMRLFGKGRAGGALLTLHRSLKICQNANLTCPPTIDHRATNAV